MSTESASSEPTRLGSFVIQPELPTITASVSIPVVGADDGPFAGRAGFAFAVPVPSTPDAGAAAEVQLAKLRHFSHPALAPVLESGIDGSVAYWVHAVPDGKPLDTAALTGDWPIRRVQNMVTQIGGALQIAHELGLGHGHLDASAVFAQPDGEVILTGLGIAGAAAANDQKELAELAIGLLAAKQWIEPDAMRAHRVREWLNAYTERVSTVLSRASDPDPAERYPDMAGFVSAFTDAVRMSAEDLVHAAFEAISARSPEMAQLIAERAAAYDPHCDSLALLTLQLRGGTAFGDVPLAPVLSAPVAPVGGRLDASARFPAIATAADQSPAARSLLPMELTQGLPQEFLDSIAPQFEVQPIKKGMNPLLVLMLGGAGIVLLLAIAGAATFLVSGS